MIAYNLGRLILLYLIKEFSACNKLRNKEIACGYITYAKPESLINIKYRKDIIVLIICKYSAACYGTRSYNPYDLSFYKPLCKLRIFHLLRYSHLVSVLHKSVYISFSRMIRHTAHRSSLFKSAVLACKCKFKLLCHHSRIIKKHFIKIAQAIKKYTIRILVLSLQIL